MMLPDDARDRVDPRLPATEAAPIGLQRGLVQLVNYRPEWKQLFEDEATRLRAALGNRSLQIEHVGSTSIEEMAAKPILDIVVGIKRLSEGPDAIAALEGINYEHIREDPVVDRIFLVKGTPGMRQIHLSLAEPESACWRSHVLFRDYLRSQPKAAADYATIKRQLAARHPADRASYTAGKAAFIELVLQAALREVDWHGH